MQEMGSFVEGSKNPRTHTSIPKSMEEVATKVMHVNKVAKLFQTMVIVSLNMGNWIRGETFRKGINIMWKFGGRTRQRPNRRLKWLLKNYMMRMWSSRVA